MSSELVGRKFWKIEHLLDDPLIPPEPKRVIECDVCGGKRIYFKDYSVIKHPLHKDQYRIDIFIKCGDCGNVKAFGVHITKEEYQAILRRLRECGHFNPRVTWEDIRIRHYNVNDVFDMGEDL